LTLLVELLEGHPVYIKILLERSSPTWIGTTKVAAAAASSQLVKAGRQKRLFSVRVLFA